jgi:hypothetical protein
MPSPDGLADGLDVVGQLSVLADDDTPFSVEFRGGVIAVLLPDFGTARRLRARPASGKGERRAMIRRIQSILARSGLELQVWVRGRRLGRLTGSSRSTRLASLLGVDPMEIRIRDILAALAGRPSP